tara:strand:- start:69 stop:392 length:324 start_codon:yes stop_codon:yes gene_type:complete
MNLEEQIKEVKKQLDLILSYSNDGWFSRDDYSLLSKSARRKDSRYGLITDILNYGEEGQRIIDHNTNKKTLHYLVGKCMEYIETHPTRDFPGGFSNRQIGWKRKQKK